MLYLILAALYIRGFAAEDGPYVDTSLGRISGFYRSSYEGRIFSAFEGIPYAKPPVGDLRFEAPQPVSPWNDVLNASTQYRCKQAKNPIMLFGGKLGTEDCLYLNVYVPNKQPSESDSYDVIVNIHGGAFMAGDASLAGPEFLMDRDIIYVNMNYRLGILGFLSTEDHTVPGNNGLKDQQLALKWVQAHIKQFGGNSNSVTLMGLSSGGVLVHFHYFSSGSKGLFHRGISQSGTALMSWSIQENALQKARKLAVSLNCKDADTKRFINCLKKIPVDRLIKHTKDFYHVAHFPIAPFAPVLEVESDSAFISKHPYKQLEDGEVNNAPWLAWIAKDEGISGAMFLTKILDEVDNHWNEWSEHFFDYSHVCPEVSKKEVAQKIKTFYFKDEKLSKSNIQSLIEIFGDRLFKVGFETAVQKQIKVAEAPVYAGIYGYKASVSLKNIIGNELEGVPHASESILLHDSKFTTELLDDIRLSESDISMKNILVDFVTSFAKDGKPQSNGIDWKPIMVNDPKYMLINGINNVTMTEIPKLTPIEFWESLNFMENSRAERLRDEL